MMSAELPETPVSRETLLAYLDACAFDTLTFDHPALFTVEDSQKLRGEIEGAYQKPVFERQKGQLFSPDGPGRYSGQP